MSAAFTSGPWEWRIYGELVGKDGGRVLYGDCDCLDGARAECDNDADKALIAAAPDLYAALLPFAEPGAAQTEDGK